MCDVRIKVTAGIGAGGAYRCSRNHPAALEMYRAGQTTLNPEIHEVYLGWGGAVLRWDDAGWQWLPKGQASFEVLP